MFEDVCIVVDGYYEPVSFLAKFIKTMRERPRIRHKWVHAPDDVGHVIALEGQRVQKLSQNWETHVLSAEQLSDALTYVEIKIVQNLHDYGGIFFGISKTNSVGESTFMDPESTVCVYNDQSSLGSDSIIPSTDCSFGPGDVIGLVVDKTKDEIVFFKNGRQMAQGATKPSQMEPMYLIMWLYYSDAIIEMCNEYTYSSLQRT
jgi:hypothetical protein